MIRALFKTMRPRQWTKNVFVLAPLLFDGQILQPIPLIRTIFAAFLFCLISGAVYIINDILDADSDRRHPTKCKRPIASGKLPVPIAITAFVVIILTSLPAAFWLSPAFAGIAVGYLIINLAYSNWLKHIPLIDVLIIAAGFVLRVAAGVTVVQVERFSPWLYVVTTLFALYLGFGKRRAELVLLTTSANTHRKVLDGYTIPLLDQLITIVSSTTVVAYSLYTFSAPNLPQNHTMMLTIPFVLYGIFRYLFLIHLKDAGGEPEELLLTDRPLQATVVLWGISVFVFLYLLS